MRFKLTLQVLPNISGRELPINYQYEISAVIYRILSQCDKNYSLWLHDNGYRADEKHYKLFSFSNLIISQYAINKEHQRLVIKSDTVDLFISFLPKKSIELFTEGIFHLQTFRIADKISGVEFKVQDIYVMPPVEYQDEMYFETLSPICVSQRRDNGMFDYLSPNHPAYVKGLLTGLLTRYQAYHGKEYEREVYCDFKVLNEPKSVLVKIKAGTPQQTFVRGYRYKFKIRLPKELMMIGYEDIFGEKGSLGFGMVRKIDI